MKKIITLTNLVFLITLAACDPKPNDPFSMNVALELLLNDHLPEIYRSLLPIEYIMPTQLPSTINDPHLFVAWIYLYNQNDPITIHDGSTLTGRDLAMVVIERSVPVSWGSKLICNGNSCAKRFACENMECVENFKPDEVYPIYISQRYQDTENITLARLAGSLAHELYHYILPFDSVQTSLYEEYWAFYIGANVEQAKWAIFDPYDPNTAACLMAWFRVHGQKGYFGSDIYPMTLETPVDTTSEVCLP